jgi:small subunit ribosomal protein S3
MAKKTHPKILRIGLTENWLSKGFYEKNRKEWIEEDFRIRQFLEEKLKKAYIEKIEIERLPQKIQVNIYTMRPGMIIGRKGEGVEQLVKEMYQKVLKRKNVELKIEIKEVKNPWLSAPLVAYWMAQEIEKRVPYRRVLKTALSKIMSQKEVKGARVQVKGRLDGVEIARTEWLQEGQLPRQKMRAEIDFAEERAFCTYGVVGVKVWIYKGEKFD